MIEGFRSRENTILHTLSSSLLGFWRFIIGWNELVVPMIYASTMHNLVKKGSIPIAQHLSKRAMVQCLGTWKWPPWPSWCPSFNSFLQIRGIFWEYFGQFPNRGLNKCVHHGTIWSKSVHTNCTKLANGFWSTAWALGSGCLPSWSPSSRS